MPLVKKESRQSRAILFGQSGGALRAVASAQACPDRRTPCVGRSRVDRQGLAYARQTRRAIGGMAASPAALEPTTLVLRRAAAQECFG